MQRSSSLLDVFSLIVVSAAADPRRARRPAFSRSDLMRMQLRHGATPCAEMVIDGPRGELQPLLPPRGQTAKQASYRVRRFDGAVLHTRLLLPRRRTMPTFRIRIRHPDGNVDRLRPVEADGLVTEAPLAIWLRPGPTIVDIEEVGRIELHWAGAERDRDDPTRSRAPVGDVVGGQRR